MSSFVEKNDADADTTLISDDFEILDECDADD